MNTDIAINGIRPARPPHRRAPRMVAAAVAALFGAGVVSGCATDDMGSKQLLGSAIGAGLAGWGASKIGNGTGRMAAIAAGTLAGAVVGGSIGSSLDKADRLSARKAQNRALIAPVGEVIQWSNPTSGNSGAVTTTREGTDTSTGAYCREYHTDIQVGGRTKSGYGTACRMPDGSWQVRS